MHNFGIWGKMTKELSNGGYKLLCYLQNDEGVLGLYYPTDALRCHQHTPFFWPFSNPTSPKLIKGIFTKFQNVLEVKWWEPLWIHKFEILEEWENCKPVTIYFWPVKMSYNILEPFFFHNPFFVLVNYTSKFTKCCLCIHCGYWNCFSDN